MRKSLLVFLFFISIRIYAVAETAVVDVLLLRIESCNTVEPDKIPTDTLREVVISVDACDEMKKDTMDDMPFFFFEKKVSSYKTWFNSFKVF